MKLVFPTIEHKQAAMDYRQEHIDCGEARINGSGGLMQADEYEPWLRKITSARTFAAPGLVKASVYFGIADGKIVGTIQIRHALNDALMKSGGHIGYGVRPSERRKGYATRMLALALEKCREMGIERVLITCWKDNIASAKTIVKGGGVLENEVVDENGESMQRYWIDLNGIAKA